MTLRIRHFAFLTLAGLVASLWPEMAVAQVEGEIAVSEQVTAGGTPVAYVYVGSRAVSGESKIEAFSSGPDGELTPVSNSPFSVNALGGMAVHGNYLFGTNGIDIFSFAVEPNGALYKVSSINARQFNGANCGGATSLFVDRGTATLYDIDVYGNQCANNTYQSFAIEGSGELKYLGMTSAASPVFNTPLSFIGNNLYGYGSTCYHFSAGIYGFARSASGTLRLAGGSASMPTAKEGNFYCTYLTAADQTNHVAVSVQQLSGSTWAPVGAVQVATYTADSAGRLSTKSAFSNMPSTGVKYVTDLKASPSGNLLAVAGSAGLQVFHFNGSGPITHYTAVLAGVQIDQMFWDKANHLYAISRYTNQLFVFTITPTSVEQAPGSPYSILEPQTLAVLPRS
jgi:hypothetical protein